MKSLAEHEGTMTNGGIDVANSNGNESNLPGATDVDVVVVGAGFAGLYLLHRLRGLGMSAQCFETAAGVGGTWYWNRYPGARCDVESIDYSYSFDAELDEEWRWSERYATQPEILSYLEHVAGRFDLLQDIRFSTRVEAATWDDEQSLWRLRTDVGEDVACRHYVMATGCLSQPKTSEIEGHGRFGGEIYFTSRWPHEGVDFSGKRVGVIGTGSSAIQSIPVIAKQSKELTVFQRTPNFSIPARNGPDTAEKRAAADRDRAAYREQARRSRAGVPVEVAESGAMMVSEEERNERFEKAWSVGGLFATIGAFNDMLVNLTSNETLAEFIRDKIRGIVKDPVTAEALCPTNHPFGTKRPCLDDNYYDTYNQPHVKLVDLLKDPIQTITETGIDTAAVSHTFFTIVFATGFDAMTGAIVSVDITGRKGLRLADKWAEGPKTYLGLTTVGFPNFFAITGPGSPSVLSNMAVSIEQHVDWVCDLLGDLCKRGVDTIEPTEMAEAGWVQHVNDYADITLYPRANSWYMGANVPGKARVFLPYVGGVGNYRAICEEVVEKDYLGFTLDGEGQRQCNDGIIRRLQPDVAIMLGVMASMDLPPLESLSVGEARAFIAETQKQRAPGPDVGEIVDGQFPGATRDLDYRLYRPASPGPHPIVAYFHGGGWVLGGAASDDPLCRDLCVQSDAIIISMDYRHAPEERFPAAPDDGYAAVQWIADRAESLGGVPGQLAVTGWSAGANVAAVVCQTSRDSQGPAIAGQVLLTPVTDATKALSSKAENAEGYVLTSTLMDWFWDHYADPIDRANPKASPLRAADLSELPPALVVTCEFDPLRDEGAAYADALTAAGVDVEHLSARGQIHTSIPAVDMLRSGAYARQAMATALKQFFATSVSV